MGWRPGRTTARYHQTIAFLQKASPTRFRRCPGSSARTRMGDIVHGNYRKPENELDRLLRWCRPSKNGCLVWLGYRTTDGYGRLSKSSGGLELAHRMAWRLVHGPIPDGKCVLHHCDNPPCVRVDHLFLGTQNDNMKDMAAKGRGRKPRCK